MSSAPASATRATHVVVLLAVVGALLAGAWWLSGQGAGPASRESAPSESAPQADPRSTGSNPGPSEAASADTRRDAPSESARPRTRRVVVVSVDGLASYAVTGEQMPVLTRLLDEGAGTLNARTAVERTVTLPNHTGMVTGRRIDPAGGGHGVTWNVASARDVRPGVSSVFEAVSRSGGSSAVFVGKTKFLMWDRSWPGAIDEFVVQPELPALTDSVVGDLRSQRRELVFFHIGLTDAAGHRSGWDSAPYDAAVRQADAALGEVVETIEGGARVGRETVLIVTADHGGEQGTRDHADARALVNYQVPFVVWGRGVAAADLYSLNPDYADPGDAQPGYGGAQPVRNAAVANLALDLLGLPPVPGSEVDPAQDLDVR